MTKSLLIFQDAPDDGGRSGGGNKRPDWICNNCQARVFGSRDSCYKCNEPKGDAKVQYLYETFRKLLSFIFNHDFVFCHP